MSSTNCLKKLSSNQKYLILQSHFQLDNSYSFLKAIQTHNKIPHQIVETLKEGQVKYPKIVEALDLISNLIGNKIISY